MKRAAPTSQFILMFTCFSGLIVHSILGHPDYYQALLLSIGAFAGGILGARLSLEIKEKKLKIIVIIVIIAAAIKLIIDSTGIFKYYLVSSGQKITSALDCASSDIK